MTNLTYIPYRCIDLLLGQCIFFSNFLYKVHEPFVAMSSFQQCQFVLIFWKGFHRFVLYSRIDDDHLFFLLGSIGLEVYCQMSKLNILYSSWWKLQAIPSCLVGSMKCHSYTTSDHSYWHIGICHYIFCFLQHKSWKKVKNKQTNYMSLQTSLI